jgi:hypothetical protein
MPLPECDYCGTRDHNVDRDAKAHKEMYATMQALGWFWGSIRTMLRKGEQVTIREAIRKDSVYQCMVLECGKIFPTKKT